VGLAGCQVPQLQLVMAMTAGTAGGGAAVGAAAAAGDDGEDDETNSQPLHGDDDSLTGFDESHDDDHDQDDPDDHDNNSLDDDLDGSGNGNGNNNGDSHSYHELPDCHLWASGRHHFHVVGTAAAAAAQVVALRRMNTATGALEDSTLQGLPGDERSLLHDTSSHDSVELQQLALLQGRQPAQIVCSHRAGEVLFLTTAGEV
jgi:hypothetical protein